MTKITHIDHIAIAVNSIEEARHFYEQGLGLAIYRTEDLPDRGIRTAFIKIGQTKLELIEPLNDTSEISGFLKKRGPGIHHIALNCSNISKMQAHLSKNAIKLIYDQPQSGANNKEINFVHPKSAHGVLYELVEKKS